MIAAADEITRLRAENVREQRDNWRLRQNMAARLADHINGTPCAEIRRQQERETLTAENERLRAAMEDIAYPNPVHGEDQLMQIARAALEGKQ
jgi:hypothetical protein